MKSFLEMSDTISLNFKKPDPGRAEEFIQAVYGWGKLNPINSKEVVIGGTLVELFRYPYGPSNHVELRSLRKMEENASSLGFMRKLVALADKMGITLYGTPKPFGDFALTQSRLVKFYKLFGFEYDKKKNMVVRNPRNV